MSESEEGWFHCGRCGHLFRGQADPGRRGACPSCGGDPVPDAPQPVEEPAAGPAMVRHKRRRKSAEDPEKPKSRQHGSRKKARAVMIFTIVWVLMLGVLAVMSKHLWPDSPTASDNDSAAFHSALGAEDQQLLQIQIPACSQTLQQFLANPAPESRAAQVLGSIAMIGKMALHQQGHPILRSEEVKELLHRDVLRTPAGRAIETLWKLDEERTVEAVFFEDDEGEWRLDWENLVRFNTEPWALFLAGLTGPEGEFRLLARESSGELEPHELGLILHAPRADKPGETAAPLSGLVIPRDSEMGRRVLAAFEARKRDLGAFGSKLASGDPENMIRLRVRISRHEEEGGERTFRIESIPACHWLHFDGEEMP